MTCHGRARLWIGLVVLLLLIRQVLSVAAVQDVWAGVERIVAIGDVHGDYEQFVAVLRSAKLIDSQESWSGGKTDLVQSGDVLDRGPRLTQGDGPFDEA